MELDTSKKPYDAAENKDTKKSKKKRTPAHVPLPLDEKKKGEAQQKSSREKTVAKEPKKPKHARRHEQAEVHQADVRPAADTDTEKSVVDTPKHEASSEANEHVLGKDAEHDASHHALQSEQELPLHVHAEGEVFVSDRLKPEQPDTGELLAESQNNERPVEDTEQGVASSTEVVDGGDDEVLSDTNEDTTTRSESKTNTRQRQTGGGHAPTAGAVAGASPFLAQWRNRQAGGGGVPPQSPRSSSMGGNVPPVPPSSPNVMAHNPSVPPAARHNTMPLTAMPAPERVRDRASERRHLVTGLVVGALIEHIRHKRREKRMEKAHKKEVGHLKNNEARAHFEKKQAADKALREKTALEQTIERMKKQNIKEIAPAAASSSSERAPSLAAAMQHETEKIDSPKTAEVARKEMEERARRAVEALHAEAIEVPKGHHIEQSSWHAIEVDNKTGKAVEESAITYGQAFEQERHQEQLHGTTSDTAEEPAHNESPLTAMEFPHQQTGGHTTKDSNTQTVSSHARERTVDIARAAASRVGQIQPIDALLWVILGIIILIIMKLL